MNEWKTIESAPRDGKDILLFDGTDIYTGCWAFDDWRPTTLDFHGCGCCGEAPPIATHWMPLPKPPEE